MHACRLFGPTLEGRFGLYGATLGAKQVAADQRVALARAEGIIQGLQARPPGGFAAWWRSVRGLFKP